MARIAETEGKRLLSQFLSRAQKSHDWLAKLIGVTQPTVSSWVAGSARPERHIALVVERVCGIPAEAWLTETERNYVIEAFARVATGTEG